MTAKTLWFRNASSGLLLIGLSTLLQAQGPAAVQFTADIQVRDLDGATGTGKLFVGTAKQRMEFAAFGETRPTIIDPANGTQNTISLRQRRHMELPYGESGGTVRIPKLTSVNPADPCAAGELSDCKRLGAETLNGLPTQKWEYTNGDGERITAWIATRLRFPIRTVADTGATNELRNVVEAPQAASLFLIPSDFTQVDDLGGSGNPIADALASLNPALIQQGLATARQMDAENKADPTRATRASVWEAGAGYVMNLTVTMKAAMARVGTADIWQERNVSMRYTASIPMNYGTPAVPPSIGPLWTVLQPAGSGSPQAEALPVTMNVEWEEQRQVHRDMICGITEKTDTTTVVKGRAAGRGSITQPVTQGTAQAMFKINGALTSYDVLGGATFNNQADLVTAVRTVDHCAGDRVTNTTQNSKSPNPSLAIVDIKEVPLPPSPTGLKGTRTAPFRFMDYTGPAQIEWNIARIAAR